MKAGVTVVNIISRGECRAMWGPGFKGRSASSHCTGDFFAHARLLSCGAISPLAFSFFVFEAEVIPEANARADAKVM